ncbi:MAG TPA: MFS transporter [Syntrophomonadaceae bacterium]|nr:MFS transporter [Syntrophomonadaceae bacterium]
MSVKNKAGFPFRYLVIGIVLLLWTTIYFQRINISVLLVDHKFLADMGLIGKGARQGLLMTLYLVVYSISNMLLAPLGDKIGPRKTILLAFALAIASMTAGGFAVSFGMVLTTRIILGVGQGIYFPAQNILVNNWFPPSERGLANGIYGLGGCLGPILGIPIFTSVVRNYSWEWTFFFGAIMGAVFCIPLMAGVVSDKPSNNKYIRRAEKDYICQTEPQTELGNKTRSLIWPVITSFNFWLAAISYMAYLSIWWGVMTWLPQYLTVARGFSLEAMGWGSTAPYFAAIAGVLGGGYVSDHMRRREVCCFIGLALSTVFLLTATYSSSNVVCITFMALAVGMAEFYWAPLWALVQTMLPDEVMGTCTGIINGSANLVSAAAPLVMGILIQSSHNYEAGLLYLAIFGAVGAVGLLMLLRRPVCKY